MKRDRALRERHALGKLVYSKDMLCRLPTRDEIEDVTLGSSMELEEFASAKDLSCEPDGYYLLPFSILRAIANESSENKYKIR
jgi:hypothetical protein